MPSSIQAGNTGSGKSEALKLFLAWILAIYKSAAVVYDPKGPLFYELVAYYVGQGKEKRIVAHAFGGEVYFCWPCLKREVRVRRKATINKESATPLFDAQTANGE